MNTSFFIITLSGSENVTKKMFQNLYKQCYQSLQRLGRGADMPFYVDVVHGISDEGELSIEVYLDIAKFTEKEIS